MKSTSQAVEIPENIFVFDEITLHIFLGRVIPFKVSTELLQSTENSTWNLRPYLSISSVP